MGACIANRSGGSGDTKGSEGGTLNESPKDLETLRQKLLKRLRLPRSNPLSIFCTYDFQRPFDPKNVQPEEKKKKGDHGVP